MAISRPGKGSTKPANVKLRPAPTADNKAKPRRKGVRAQGIGHCIQRTEFDSDEDLSIEDGEAEKEADYLRDGHTGGVARWNKATASLAHVEEERPLLGMTVCMTGKLEITREDIRSMCDTTGARFEASLTVDTTFLLAEHSEGEKYRAAIDNRIPVLHTRFIQKIHELWVTASSEIDVQKISDDERLPPLRGLRICLTGYDPLQSSVSQLRENIAKAGGADYTADLDNHITHLVVGPNITTIDELSASGKGAAALSINRKRRRKAKHCPDQAVQEPIKIVWGEWVEDSLLAFGRMREELYNVEIANHREDMPSRRISRPLSLKERLDLTKHRLYKKRKPSSVLRQDTVVASDHSMHIHTGNSAHLEDDGVLSAKQEHQLAAVILNVDADVSFEEPEPAMVRKERSSSCALPRQDSRSAPLKRARSSALTELSGVEALLGSKPTRAYHDRAVAGQEDVCLNSLRPPAGASMPRPPSSLLSRIDRNRAAKLSSADIVERKSIVSVTGEDVDSSGPAAAIVLEEIIAPIFAGCKLHMSLPGVPVASLAKVQKNITDRGGTIAEFIADDVDYVVCKTVATCAPEYDINDPRVRSIAWLERCIILDELVTPEDSLAWMHRPMRLSLPIMGAAKISLCYTGFDEDEKLSLEKLFRSLQLEASTFMDRHKTTHLLIPDVYYSGKKLGPSQEWGISVVLPNWISNLAASNPPVAAIVNQNVDICDAGALHDQTPNDIGMEAGVALAESRSSELLPAPAHTGPLTGCIVHIHPKMDNRSALMALTTQLGATLAHTMLATKPVTHFVFQSKRNKDPCREFKVAVEKRIHVVHPEWLQACSQANMHLPEQTFKHTYDGRRGLQVVVATAGQSTAGAPQAEDGVSGSSDSLDLPPPLASMKESPRYSLHRLIRSPVPSPGRKTSHLISSAPASASHQSSRVPLHLMSSQSKSDNGDSGFATFSGEPSKPTSTGVTLRHSPPDASTASLGSDENKAPPAWTSLATDSSSDGDFLNPIKSTGIAPGSPTASAATRSLMLEMNAIMGRDMTAGRIHPIKSHLHNVPSVANQRGRTTRRPAEHCTSSPVSLPAAPVFKVSGGAAEFLQQGLLQRQQRGYDGLDTQIHLTSDTQHMPSDEATMVIRLEDPVAAAIKAELLAGLRAPPADDCEETLMSPPRRG